MEIKLKNHLSIYFESRNEHVKKDIFYLKNRHVKRDEGNI